MARFRKAVITNKGLALVNKVQTGAAVLKFKRIVTGAGSHEELEDLSGSTALKDKRQEFLLSSISVVDSDTVKLRSVISNDTLEQGYYIKEIGLIADDPDEGEILYSIAAAVEGQWDYLPAKTEVSPATITLDLFSSVANAETVTIQGGTGAYAAAEDLELLKETVEKYINAGPIVVTEEEIPVESRKAGHWYFCVTDKQAVSTGNRITAGPSMGLEIVN